MWSSRVHAPSSLPSSESDTRHGAPVCATDSSMCSVSGPGAMLVTAPEKSFSSFPQGPSLMPVLELRAGGHAKRECDGAKSDSQPSILGRHDAVLRHGKRTYPRGKTGNAAIRLASFARGWQHANGLPLHDR